MCLANYLLSFACLPVLVVADGQTATLLATLDWDLVLKALGFVVAAIVAYVQARGLYSASRTSLKTDLEILKLLDMRDRNYHIVKTAIDARIARLYEPRRPATKSAIALRLASATAGLIMAVGFSYLTFKLIQPGFTWWSLLTGYLALAGIGLVFQSVFGTGFPSDDKGADISFVRRAQWSGILAAIVIALIVGGILYWWIVRAGG
jgi:hypothetical protein